MRSPLAVLLLLSTSALAQINSSVVLSAPPGSVSCPVLISAERKPNPGMVNTDHGTKFKGQLLEVSFHDAQPSTKTNIVKIDGILHGMTPGVHVMPAGVSQRGPARSTETFQLIGTDIAPLRKGTVFTQTLGAVEWLELTRIEFANGGTWETSANSRCTAAPSGLLLVDKAN